MANRYTEVLMTYVRRPFSSWQAALWIALILWAVFSDGFGHPGHIGTGSVTSGGVYLGLWLWLHFREQMVQPRRAVTPHCVSTNIAVFVALVLLTVSGPPLLMLTLNHGLRAGLFLALALYIFGLVGWAVAANTLPMMVVCLVAFFGPLKYLGLLWSTSDAVPWAASPCLLLSGLAAGSWAIWKLSHITEGPRGYGQNMCRTADGSYNLGSFGRATGLFFGQLFGPSTNTPQMDGQNDAAQITYGIPMALDGTLAGTLRRWRHMYVLGPYLFAAALVLIYVALHFVHGRLHSPADMFQDVHIIVLWGVVLPWMASRRWQSDWPCIAVESLRPESRAQFARGILLTVAFQILLAWLIFAAGVWLAVVVVDHSLKGTETLDLYLLATGMMLPLASAIVCRVLSHGSQAALSWAAVGFVTVGMSITLSFCGAFQAVSVAAVLMVAGLILIPFVYRHWLNMEMG